MLNQDEIEELEALLELEAQDRARYGLLAFARYVMPGWIDGPHLNRLAAKLEAVERGECKRLLVTMPPRHGKSQMASIIFPAWCLGRNPRRKFVVASYGADLAKKHGREANRMVNDEPFRALFPECKTGGSLVETADEWETPGGGGYKCVGVGGALTGHGGDILLVDDPYKNRAEANSPTIRDSVRDWYRSTLRTRLSPGGSIILIATRWHPADLTGELLADPDGEPWDLLHLPAIDAAGAALWPARWPLEELARIRAAVGKHEWNSLYQGEPTIRGGNVFNMAGVRRVPAKDFPQARYVRAWDLASSTAQRSGDDPDWTVGVLGTITYAQDPATGARLPQLWVRDVSRIRAEAPARNARIKATAEQDGPAVNVVVESFGAYKDAAAELRLALNGIRIVREIRPPGDKAAKAAPLEPIFEAGNVFIPDNAPWADAWLNCFESFPAGAHDDDVDATALVWHEMATPRAGLAIGG